LQCASDCGVAFFLPDQVWSIQVVEGGRRFVKLARFCPIKIVCDQYWSTQIDYMIWIFLNPDCTVVSKSLTCTKFDPLKKANGIDMLVWSHRSLIVAKGKSGGRLEKIRKVSIDHHHLDQIFPSSLDMAMKPYMLRWGACRVPIKGKVRWLSDLIYPKLKKIGLWQRENQFIKKLSSSYRRMIGSGGRKRTGAWSKSLVPKRSSESDCLNE